MTKRSSRSLALFVLAGSWLAGCTAPNAPGGAVDPTTVPTDLPLPLPLPQPARPELQMMNCTQVGLAFETARYKAQAVVPEAFNPRGQTLATTDLIVHATNCDRVLDNGTVYGRASFFWTTASAGPRNSSWQDPEFGDTYVLDFVTNSPAARDRLAQAGVRVDLGTIEVSKTADVPDQGEIWEWKVTTDSMEARFHHRLHSEDPQVGHRQISFWFGTERFARVRTNSTVIVDTLITGGDFSITGSSRLGQAMLSPASPWIGSTYTDSRWDFELEPGFFGA